MKEKSFELRPTLGIKLVLTVLCAVAGAILAIHLFR